MVLGFVNMKINLCSSLHWIFICVVFIKEANQSVYENVDDFEDPWISFKEWQIQNKIKTTQIENADEKFNATSCDVSKLAPEILNISISRPEKLLENNNELDGNVDMEDKLASIPSLYMKDEHIAGNVSKLNSGIYNLNINQPSTSLEDNSELDTSDENDSSLSWHPNEDDEELSSETDNSVDSCEDVQNDNKVEIVEKNNVIQNEKCIKILEDVLIREATTTNKGKISVEKKIECSLRKGRVWDKKDRCSYCNLDVTNFSRHLFRKHSSEESVKQILLLKKGDIKRKHMIDLLRKDGNFSVLSNENLIRAVQRPTAMFENHNVSSDYLPCKYCKGLYKTQSLKRHAKACFFNNEKMNGMKYASEGQTMVAFTASRKKFLDRLRLKSEVFNTMQADRISLNGKSDILICQYAEDYLRKHKRPHIKHAVSNKIREFGRLLIPLQDIYGINSMLEALTPENYDKIVQATRIISGYNENTKSFEAASLAMHMRTSLLSLCNAAKLLILKKDPILPIDNFDNALKNIKRFTELVSSNWKFAMGSLALKDLNEKHSLKPQTLPVTEDIILFKNYTHNIAQNCINNLKNNLDELNSYKKLTEAVLALTILLNRKRVGDVQYMKMETYNHQTITTTQEECLKTLKCDEVELAKHFKRVVTIGKGSKPVPILFSKNMQTYIDVLLSVRKRTDFVPKENIFLFALPGSSKWVNGSSVLRRFAVNCGAKNPDNLTSSRLRKQIATVLQILNLNENEMEQVAQFMGHTRKTHEEFYRLPQEVFQTAKIAKLLLMMEKGVCAENKGRTLNEIDLEIKTWNTHDLNLKQSSIEDVQAHNCEENEINYEKDTFEDCNFVVKKDVTEGIQTTPSMEECPHDSIDLDGNCFCNPESCTKPLCLFDLELATNGTDLPGDCCPTYSCVGCANETMIEGQCPCAEGAVLDSNGICKCTDEEKSLVDGKCECDTNLCELPEVCNDTSVRVTEETGGCCKKTKCIECPFDSYPTNRGSDEIEEKCSCYKCKYDCGKNEVRVEKQGTGFPGSCCDLYQCVESSDFCNVGNNTFKNGENWTTNGQFCICQNGISKCFRDNNKEDQKQYCRKDGINYQDGESWTDEECTNCTCHNGTETCVSHFCDLTETQKEFVRTPHNCANSTDGTWQMIGSCKNCTCRNGTSHCISICDTFDRNKITCSPLLNCNKKCNLGFKIKYGCEICKCNRYLDLLIRKNISDVDFMKFIEEFHITTLTPMTTTTSTLETTTITSDDPICIGKKDPSNDFLEDHSTHLVCYILLMVFGAVLILAILAVIFIYRKCQSHSKQDSLNVINCKYNPIVNQNNNIKEM